MNLSRQERLKIEPTHSPWITTEVRKALNRRYRLLCKWQRTKAQHDHDSYKKARNFAKKSLKSAESNYWKAEFRKTDNSKDFWNTVRRVERKRTNKKIGPIEDDNVVIKTDDTIKADLIKDYFTSVGKDFAKKLPATQQPKHSFISRVTPTLDIIDIDEEHCKPIDDHAQKQKLYSDKQWGYSEGKSTETHLLLLIETWKHIIDRGEIVGALFIDFRKAFDSIDHHILLEKLQGFGISGSAYEIIEYYLTDRSIYRDK
eukprot:gene17109-8626_t